MGYYDGLGGISEAASSSDVAAALNMPVVLVVNCRGMSISVVPLIKGFLEYQNPSRIKGVILNQMPKSLYADMKAQIERWLPVKVLGYVPKVEDLVLESRHLGLVLPGEIESLKEKLNRLAAVLEESIDLDAFRLWPMKRRILPTRRRSFRSSPVKKRSHRRGGGRRLLLHLSG